MVRHAVQAFDHGVDLAIVVGHYELEGAEELLRAQLEVVDELV